MFNFLMIFSASLCLILVVIQLIWYFRFINLVSDRRVNDSASADFSSERSAWIVLSLRGRDPFLRRTLDSLFNQSHQNFRLRIVVDSEYDSAWQTLNPFLQDNPSDRIETQILQIRHQTCGLKNSALLQATDCLPADCDVVVLIDADAVPHQNWLREMLAPFANSKVGAVSGLRWYTPQNDSLAAKIRSCWGIGAMVQMHQFNMMWGGSLAIRSEVIQSERLRNLWKNRLVDDLIVNDPVHALGQRCVHAPVVLANQESINFKDCFSFISRQLFFAKVGHAAWTKIFFFSVASSVAFFLHLALIAMSLTKSFGMTSFALVVIVALYAMAHRILMTWADSVVRRRLQDQNCTVPSKIQIGFPLLVMTLCVFNIAAISAQLRRTLRWRGILYHMDRHRNLRRQNDTPYVDQLENATASVV